MLGKEKKMIFNEDSNLYKGIFWIIDPDNPYSSSDYCFKILSDTFGNSLDPNLNLNAKSGTTYNHKLVWQQLSRKETFGKPFNYFPRGRIEIHNGVAKIFLNGNINTAETLDFLTDEFNLSSHNGIKDIKIIEDNSHHYLCHLDNNWKEDK